MTKIKDMPIEEKPREKALFYGLNSLSNAELLALIISCGTKNHSALEVSYDLLTTCNGVSGIVKAPLNALTKVEGINKAKALKLQAAFLLYERSKEECVSEKLNIKGKEQIALYFRNKLASLAQEKAFIVIVNRNNKVTYIKELFRGTQHKLMISSRMVVKEVMDKGNRFFVIHNHPSNNPLPSMEDRTTTSQIEMLGYSFGVELVDHLIVTKDKYYSIIENKEYCYMEED